MTDWSVGDTRSIIHRFTQDEILEFAKLTGDRNPLHVDRDYAQRSLMGGQVVHGMLAASFVSTLIGMEIPGNGALWNQFEIRWRKPIRIGTELNIIATVCAVTRSTQTLDLEIRAISTTDDKLYFEAKAKVTMMDEPSERQTGDVRGKRVLITGASGDVGFAIASRLAGEGATILAWGQDRERFAARPPFARSIAFRAVDLQDVEATRRAISAELSEGPISAYVHAAAAAHSLHSYVDSYESLKSHWKIGVESFYIVSSALVQQMPSQAMIVAVLSQAVYDAPPVKYAAYLSAKMALWGLVKSMAQEFGPRGIRVNAVSPSMMNTAYTADIPPRIKQIEAAKNPLRRMCEPVDVADAVAYLCGPGAAFVNGINLPVTGGANMP